MQSWNYSRGTPGLVNDDGIVEIFVIEIIPIVRRGRGFLPSLGVGGLREEDGIILELGQSIGREVVEAIVGEAALSVCMGRHAARSSLGAGTRKQWNLQLFGEEDLDIVSMLLWEVRFCRPRPPWLAFRDLHIAAKQSAQPATNWFF